MELRLVKEVASDPRPSSAILLNGKQWYLTDPMPFSAGSDAVTFVCISYVWGTGRAANPFHEGQLMSDETLPALSAAIAQSLVINGNTKSSPAFWIDALCIPHEPGPRLATLGSMGYIYSRASSVMIILPSAHHALVQAMQERRNSATISPAALLALEDGDWIKSVWTYQEVVNAQQIYFICSDLMVEGMDCFSFLGHVIERYKKAHGISDTDIAQTLPKVDAFSELLADFRMASYARRSALSVLAQNRYRYNFEPKNYFYAAIGAVFDGPWKWDMDLSLEQLAEEFIGVCMEKNDYSFLYCAGPRQKVRGRECYPEPGLLRPILVWHSYGDGQRGLVDENGLWLEDMVKVSRRTSLDSTGKEFMIERLKLVDVSMHTATHEEIAQSVFKKLEKMGFAGSLDNVLTNHGILFPQTPVATDATTEIYVSGGVRWTFGAAAIVKVAVGNQVEYVPGVFVGDNRFTNTETILLPSSSG